MIKKKLRFRLKKKTSVHQFYSTFIDMGRKTTTDKCYVLDAMPQEKKFEFEGTLFLKLSITYIKKDFI